jgi:hypothetical protein
MASSITEGRRVRSCIAGDGAGIIDASDLAVAIAVFLRLAVDAHPGCG